MRSLPPVPPAAAPDPGVPTRYRRGPAGRFLQAAGLAALLAAHGPAPLRADFHVAPGGSDAAPGSRSRPFATLERARDAVRELKKKQGLPRGGLTVWLHPGDHLRTQTLELQADDSGTVDSPVTWEARPGARVRLLGGVRLPPFTPVADPAVLGRLEPSARAHVVQADLRSLGPGRPAGLQSRGFARPVTPAHEELFFDSRPMPLAQWPNPGEFEKIAGFPSGSGQGDDHGGELGALPGGFLYPGERPRRWKDTRDLWVHGYWAWDWANSYEKVVELDLARHRIRTAPPHGLYGFRPGQRFYFLNVLEELDRPGEWFLDRDAAILYFWPPAPGAREALLSRLGGPLLRLQDAAHLTFRGLLLEATRGSGVEIQGGTSNQVVSCVLRNLGNLGVVIEGGVGHQVRASEILDTGDGGVAVTGGHRDTLAPGGHVVENCHFQRQARWSRCYAPAIQLSGVGLSARHNLIHDHPHAGIIFWGNDHQIEFNEIHHIALETGDVGAIYTGRDYTFRGNRIRHNFIHDTGGVGMGSMGVYLDDCVSGTEVSGNVFWRVHWAMFIGGGRDHRVENNVFVDCDPAVRVDARGLDPAPVWRNMVDETMRQRLAEVPPALYRERYPELRSLDAVYGPPGGPAITGSAFRGVPASGNVIAHNVCLGRWLEAAWHAREGDLDLLDNRVDPDPAGAPGSRLQKGLQRAAGRRGPGVRPVPFTGMGLRADAERTRVERLR